MIKNEQIPPLEEKSFLKWEAFQHWVILIALFSGLLLSIVSALNLCTSECSATKSYLFFGMPFAYTGLFFFIAALVLQLYSRRYPFFKTLIGMMVAGSLGAELMFIWIQKYRIGMWCPICLSIAALIAFTGLLMLIGMYLKQLKKGKPMQTLKKVFGSLPIALIGFFISMVAISKPDQHLLAMGDIKEKIEFGNKQSPIEVYFATDWFCPACNQLDPQVCAFCPVVMKEAGFFFIDVAIHPESENYRPYNLSSQVHNKSNYIEIRKALSSLARQNKEPDEATIHKALASLAPKFQELSYKDVKEGLNFYDEIARKYQINATPAMVIVNTKTNAVQHLKGGSEITEANVLKAIKTLQTQ